KSLVQTHPPPPTSTLFPYTTLFRSYLSVDQANRRLYVSHGTQVDVLDADKGTIVGKIPDTRGVHGIAIASEFNRGFVSDGQTNEDRKSTRLNSSHRTISYAVFCLKK